MQIRWTGRLAAHRRGAGGTLSLLLLLLAGCARKGDELVLVSGSVAAPAILRSEAEQVAIPVRIDAPLRFENRSSHEQTLSVDRKGCSCYGIATQEYVLQEGELIKVPAGGARELFFVSKLLEAEGDQAFRATLLVSRDSGFGGTPAMEAVTAECSMKIIPDLVLEPASIVVDLPHIVENKGRHFRQPLKLTRVTRGKPSGAAPQFVMDPSLLDAEEVRSTGPAEEIEPGLWRTSWETVVALAELPDDVQDNGGRFPFALEFAASPEEGLVNPAGRRNASTMPTLQEVVRHFPERKVLGTLVLRRSRGVIAPSQVHFGAIPAGDSARERRIVLTAADQKPFVVSVGDLPANFAAEVDEDEPAAQQWVTVKFRPESVGEALAVLVLTTTHPDQAEVRVTLKARVQ